MRRTRISSQGNSYRRAPARQTHPQWHARFLSFGLWRHEGSLWTDYVPRRGATVRVRTSIPGISSAEFLLRHADTPPNANDPVGVIGTDILSRVTMEFNSGTAYLSVKSCSSVALRGAGFIPVNQTGFFWSDPTLLNEGRPNVPVLFLGLGEVHVAAQIDTGYDDELYPYSIDINQALFDRLHQSGFEMAMTGKSTSALVTVMKAGVSMPWWDRTS